MLDPLTRSEVPTRMPMEQLVEKTTMICRSETPEDCHSPTTEEMLKKEKSPACSMSLYDSSTTCSSSSFSSHSFASFKSKCSQCRECDCRNGKENGKEQKQPQQPLSLHIWPTIRPDAKWKVRTVGLLAAILPGIGCYLCLAISFTLQFDKVANFTIPSTFCPGLKSMFPPVSYSIGIWKPQKYIWLMILALHLPPRFFYAIVYKNHYSLGESEYRNKRWFKEIIRLHYCLLIAEAFGLTSVSVIDIESHFKVHAICFALWLIPFNFNMLFNNILHYHSGIRKLKPMHDRVFQLKCFLFLIGYPLSVTTAISYLTFVLTCSTIPYATFSLAEYVLVGINSIFYFLLVWEFDGSKVEVYIKHVPKHTGRHQHHQNVNKKTIRDENNCIENSDIKI